MKHKISERVIQLMEKNNITGYRLSKECNIPEATISQIKQDKFNFTIEQLISISNFFGVTMDWLIKGIEHKENQQERLQELREKNLQYEAAIKKFDSEIFVLDRIRDLIKPKKK